MANDTLLAEPQLFRKHILQTEKHFISQALLEDTKKELFPHGASRPPLLCEVPRAALQSCHEVSASPCLGPQEQKLLAEELCITTPA